MEERNILNPTLQDDSEELTEYSVLASDLPKYLHKAIKEIL